MVSMSGVLPPLSAAICSTRASSSRFDGKPTSTISVYGCRSSGSSEVSPYSSTQLHRSGALLSRHER